MQARAVLSHDQTLEKFQIRNPQLTCFWLVFGLGGALGLYLTETHFGAFISGSLFILSLQQALAAYQGVKFNHEVIIIPTPIISWFPFLVFGETHIPRCEFINVMSLGKILGQEIIGFPTFLNDFCIALADKKKRRKFCDGVSAISADTLIYRKDR
jgi:hypothetical protein